MDFALQLAQHRGVVEGVRAEAEPFAENSRPFAENSTPSVENVRQSNVATLISPIGKEFYGTNKNRLTAILRSIKSYLKNLKVKSEPKTGPSQ